jgi:hypothetical protein
MHEGGCLEKVVCRWMEETACRCLEDLHVESRLKSLRFLLTDPTDIRNGDGPQRMFMKEWPTLIKKLNLMLHFNYMKRFPNIRKRAKILSM